MSQLSGNRNIKHPQQHPQQQSQVNRILSSTSSNSANLITNLVKDSNLNTTTSNNSNISINNNETILRVSSINVNSNQNTYIYYSPQQHLIPQPIASTSTSNIHQNSINVTPSTNQQIVQLQLPPSATFPTTPTTHHLSPTSPIAKKRLKLEQICENTVGNLGNSAITTLATTSETKSNSPEDIAALKKQISDYKFKKLKSLKEK